MQDDRARLRRLRLVARLREAEHRAATADAAAAADVGRRKRQLAHRAATLNAECADHSHLRDGLELAAHRVVAANLLDAAQVTEQAAIDARQLADRLLAEAHQQRRRRDRAEEECARLLRVLRDRANAVPVTAGGSRPVGTDRE